MLRAIQVSEECCWISHVSCLLWIFNRDCHIWVMEVLFWMLGPWDCEYRHNYIALFLLKKVTGKYCHSSLWINEMFASFLSQFFTWHHQTQSSVSLVGRGSRRNFEQFSGWKRARLRKVKHLNDYLCLLKISKLKNSLEHSKNIYCCITKERVTVCT